jgi:hypothetical protein
MLLLQHTHGGRQTFWGRCFLEPVMELATCYFNPIDKKVRKRVVVAFCPCRAGGTTPELPRTSHPRALSSLIFIMLVTITKKKKKGREHIWVVWNFYKSDLDGKILVVPLAGIMALHSVSNSSCGSLVRSILPI